MTKKDKKLTTKNEPNENYINNKIKELSDILNFEVRKWFDKDDNKKLDIGVMISALENLYFCNLETFSEIETEIDLPLIDQYELNRLIERLCKISTVPEQDILGALESAKLGVADGWNWDDPEIEINK